MLYGVVSAYQNISTASVSAAQDLSTATSEPTSVPTSTPSTIPPEEAAQLAALVVGNTNLLSAESSSINGVNAYMVTFTNKDVVYVGLDGQILGVQVAPVVMNIVQPVRVNNNNGGGGNDEDHDDHEDDDHEEHDD
jgi:hypothetical protein